MLYATVGIPITLLTITSLGSSMATAFRFLYRNICCRLIFKQCCGCGRKRQSAHRQLLHMGRNMTATLIPPALAQRSFERQAEQERKFNGKKTIRQSSNFSTKSSRKGLKRDQLSGDRLSLSSRQFRVNKKFNKSRSEQNFAESTSFKNLGTPCASTLHCRTLQDKAESEGSVKTLAKSLKSSRKTLSHQREEVEDLRLSWKEKFDEVFDTKDIFEVTVPIYVSCLLLTSYITLGAVLFSLWEGWTFLEGCYFSFITLSTIGFGDYVPGTKADDWSSQMKLLICAFYLIIGLAFLAMCFDLMIEQLKRHVLDVAKKIALFKKKWLNEIEEEEEEDEEEGDDKNKDKKLEDIGFEDEDGGVFDREELIINFEEEEEEEEDGVNEFINAF